MNIEEIEERSEEANHMEEYFQKAEKAQVLYCSDHDREFFDFEVCPECEIEKQYFLAEKGDLEAQKWVERRNLE
jgi:hypothetical protein